MNKKKIKVRSSKGITLIALVVTIIVLIILTGVSVNLVLGENGIITTATRAKEEQKISKYIEDIELSRGEVHTEKLGEGNIDDLIQKIYDNEIVPYGNITKLDEETAKIVTVEGYVFKVAMKNTEYIAKENELVEEGQTWSYNYTGEDQTYRVPATGTYKIELSGAQGGDSTYAGGQGGKTTVSIKLVEGDIITVKVGGQGQTYNGGGTGTVSNGGGATSIFINDTLIAIAGGGGGGTEENIGGNGGTSTSGNNNVEYTGSDSDTTGSAGGGGGYYGGTAGYYYTKTTAHSHTSSCYTKKECKGNVYHRVTDTTENWVCPDCGCIYGPGGVNNDYNNPGSSCNQIVNKLTCKSTASVTTKYSELSYGGSNWYDTSLCLEGTSEEGTQTGDGICNIQIVEKN